jgi:acyl carrier protein
VTKEERVRQIIAELLIVDETEVTPGANLRDDLGADSLDVIELTMEMEEAFDIEIQDECTEKFLTVKDVLDYIAANVSNAE